MRSKVFEGLFVDSATQYGISVSTFTVKEFGDAAKILSWRIMKCSMHAVGQRYCLIIKYTWYSVCNWFNTRPYAPRELTL